MKVRAIWPALLVLACIAASPASATLGASYASVEADRVHMAARRHVETNLAFAAHTLTTTDGGAMREYTRADGKVFAVTWRTQGRPDLRQALGPYFDTLNAANPPHAHFGGRRPLTASTADLVVRSGGHPGAFWGFAYVPQLMPVGVAPADLK